MRERRAAHSVIEVLLLEQSLVPRRSRISRLFGRSPLGPASLVWYRGAKAEIAVGRILAELPAGWIIFHALPAGNEGTDIDHLVVGPAGVFTIHTTRHRHKKVRVAGRTVIVDGERLPYIRKAEVESARVTALLQKRMLLRAAVSPVVAIVDARQITVYQPPARVKVIDADELRPWLLTRPHIFTLPERVAASDIIDSPETWDAVLGVEPSSLTEQFTQLERSVHSARIRRFVWVPGISAAVILFAAVIHRIVPALMGF